MGQVKLYIGAHVLTASFFEFHYELTHPQTDMRKFDKNAYLRTEFRKEQHLDKAAYCKF
jgi:hypothetical protein